MIVFPALRVAQMGDMFAWKDGPLCDRNNGGSCVAYPKTLAGAAASLKNIDTVIPGHSPMMTVKDVQELPAVHGGPRRGEPRGNESEVHADMAFCAFNIANTGYEQSQDRDLIDHDKIGIIELGTNHAGSANPGICPGRGFRPICVQKSHTSYLLASMLRGNWVYIFDRFW